MKFCTNCGKEISESALYCSHCGTKQEFVESEVVSVTESVSEVGEASIVAEQPVKPVKKGAKLATVIRNSLIFLISIVLLVGSFLPVTCIDFEECGISDLEEVEAEVGYNVYQYVVLLIDSFKDYDEFEDVEDLRDEMLEYAEDFEDFDDDDFSEMSAKEKKAFKQVFFLSARMSTQMDQRGPKISLVFCVLLGILYIFVSVALFIISVFNLLATFNVIKSGKAKLYAWSQSLLAASLALIISCCYVGNIMLGNVGRMSSIAICSVIFVSVAMAISMVLRYIFSNKDSVRNIVSRSVALVLAIVVVCLAFSPVLSANFKIKDGDSSKSVTVSHSVEFFEMFMIDDSEEDHFEELADYTKEQKKEYFENAMSVFSFMSSKELKGSEAEQANAEVLYDLVGAKIDTEVLGLFSATVVLFVLLVMGASLVIWQCLYFFATGKQVRALVITGKILTLVFAILSMAAVVAFAVVASVFADKYIDSKYSVGITSSLVIILVFAVGAMFCPTRLVKKERKVKVKKADSKPELEAQF